MDVVGTDDIADQFGQETEFVVNLSRCDTGKRKGGPGGTAIRGAVDLALRPARNQTLQRVFEIGGIENLKAVGNMHSVKGLSAIQGLDDIAFVANQIPGVLIHNAAAEEVNSIGNFISPGYALIGGHCNGAVPTCHHQISVGQDIDAFKVKSIIVYHVFIADKGVGSSEQNTVPAHCVTHIAFQHNVLHVGGSAAGVGMMSPGGAVIIANADVAQAACQDNCGTELPHFVEMRIACHSQVLDGPGGAKVSRSEDLCLIGGASVHSAETCPGRIHGDGINLISKT